MFTYVQRVNAQTAVRDANRAMENFSRSMGKNLRTLNAFIADEELSSDDEPEAIVPRLTLLGAEEKRRNVKNAVVNRLRMHFSKKLQSVQRAPSTSTSIAQDFEERGLKGIIGTLGFANEDDMMTVIRKEIAIRMEEARMKASAR